MTDFQSGVDSVSSPYVLGIDLGTTNSSVSVYFKGQNITLPVNGNSSSIPSVVRFADGNLNDLSVGENAKQHILIKPNEVFTSIKSLMRNEDWKDDPTLVEKLTFGDEDHKTLVTPTQIAAEILKEIRYQAAQNERLSEYGNFDKVCISVPANSSPIYKKNVMLAAEIAGFGERDENGNTTKDANGNLEGIILIDEPTAASLAYGLSNGFFTEESENKQNILVYDFGGGTFDVTILNILSERGKLIPKFTVKGTKGIAQLGGDTIDWEIVKHISSEINEQTNHDIFDLVRDQHSTAPKELRKAQSIIKNEAERIKIAFSGGVNKTQINIPDFFVDGEGHTHTFETSIERKNFLEWIDPLLQQSIDCVNDTLQEASLDIDDINKIVLVGGSCKGPWVKECILNRLNKEPYTAPNVDTIVSQGNAYFGRQQLSTIVCSECGIELGYKPTSDHPCTNCGSIGSILDPINITNHYFGIEVQGGYFAPMIEKGLKFENGIDEHSYTRKFGNAENSSSVVVTGFITQEKLEVIEENGIKKTTRPIVVHELRGDTKIFECIGEFELKGIQKAPAGTIPIELTLTVKSDNTISVTAKTENGEEKVVYWNI